MKTPENEFEYEKEMRKDEAHIHGYFKELPKWIDLPGEDEAIISGMVRPAERQAMIAEMESQRNRARRFSFDDDDSDAEEDDVLVENSRVPGFEMVQQLDVLATRWGLMSALLVTPDLEKTALGVSCQFGKTICRITDLLYAGEDAPLRISLGKRVLSDLNDLSTLLRRIALRSATLLLPDGQETLYLIRERVVAMILKYRETQN